MGSAPSESFRPCVVFWRPGACVCLCSWSSASSSVKCASYVLSDARRLRHLCCRTAGRKGSGKEDKGAALALGCGQPCQAARRHENHVPWRQRGARPLERSYRFRNRPKGRSLDSVAKVEMPMNGAGNPPRQELRELAISKHRIKSDLSCLIA